MRNVALAYMLSWIAVSALADQKSNLDSLYRLTYYEENTDLCQEYLAQAITISDQSKPHLKKLFNFHHVIGKKYAKANNQIEALKQYGQALFIADKLKDLNLQRKCAVITSKLHQQSGEYVTAAKYTTEALELSKELGNKKLEAQYYYDLGIIYAYSLDIEKSVLSLENAYDLYKTMNDGNGLSFTLMELGICSYHVGNYQEAIDYYYEAIRINNQSDILKSKVYNNHSLALMALGDTARSMQMVKKSIDLKLSLGNTDALVPALNNLGMFFLKKNELDSSLHYFLAAYNQNTMTGNDGANAFELKESYTYLDSIQILKDEKYLLTDLGVYKRYGEFLIWSVSKSQFIESEAAKYEVDRVNFRHDRETERNHYHLLLGVMAFLLLASIVKSIVRYQRAKQKKIEMLNKIAEIDLIT
ncbi:tetratricopeptide repeat protein [Reichenbachiella sp.]|uniref:tetratricopeptide repeat protein n=1 Tax=Reichenbachiella sp. TaxID=2184521 RepID=UPI003B5B50C7